MRSATPQYGNNLLRDIPSPESASDCETHRILIISQTSLSQKAIIEKGEFLK